MQSQLETVALVQAIKEQVHDSSQPSHRQDEIDQLLDNIVVLFKRSKGIALNDEDYEIQPHPHLDGLVGVPSQRICDSLMRRLRVILRFRIVSPEKIRRDLLTGLFDKTVDPITFKEYRLLSFIYNDPHASTLEWSKQMDVTQPTIRKMVKRLTEKVGLRFAHHLDYRQFKLRQFGVFFETQDVEASRALEAVLRSEISTYLKTAIFDNTFKRGYTSFTIPDQRKPLDFFQAQIDALEETYLERVQVHDITGFYNSISFDHFDFQTGDWIIESGITTLGLLNFIRENTEVLQHPRGLKLTAYRPFDQLDFALAHILVGEGRAPMRKILKRLSAFGLKAPRTTVSTRKSKLFKEDTLFPSIVFDSPMLPVFLTFAIRCNPEVTEQLLLASAQMPSAYAYASQIGCVLFIKVPTKSLGSILYLFSLLGEEDGVFDILQIQQFKNLGSKSALELLPKWKGMYWEWDESEFAIPSIGLEF